MLERLGVALHGGQLVPLFFPQTRQAEQRHRVVGLIHDGTFVGIEGPIELPSLVIDATEGYQGCARPSLGSCLEVVNQLVQVAVSLSIQVAESLQGELGTGLAEHDCRVAGDQGCAGGLLRRLDARGSPPTSFGFRTGPTTGIELSRRVASPCQHKEPRCDTDREPEPNTTRKLAHGYKRTLWFPRPPGGGKTRLDGSGNPPYARSARTAGHGVRILRVAETNRNRHLGANELLGQRSDKCHQLVTRIIRQPASSRVDQLAGLLRSHVPQQRTRHQAPSFEHFVVSRRGAGQHHGHLSVVLRRLQRLQAIDHAQCQLGGSAIGISGHDNDVVDDALQLAQPRRPLASCLYDDEQYTCRVHSGTRKTRTNKAQQPQLLLTLAEYARVLGDKSPRISSARPSSS